MTLQLYPTMTPAELKAQMIYDSKKDLMYDVSASSYDELAQYQYIFSGGLFAAPNRILHNDFSGDMMAKWTSS